MTAPNSHLTKTISSDDANELLKDWLWLVDERATVLLASLFGDLFLRYPDQSVHWLDTGAGALTQLGKSCEEFHLLLQEPENHDYWLLPDLAQEAAQVGLVLNASEVYSFKMLPVFGGEYQPDNLLVSDFKTHLSLTGTIHEQISNLPDGTRVTFKVTE